MRSRAMLYPLFAVGCYNATPAPGTPCDTTDQCPGVLECVDHVCGGSLHDASVSSIPDAYIPDGVVQMRAVIGTEPEDVRDTEIAIFDMTKNFAGESHISIDTDEFSLIYFDIAPYIATDKTVAAATLTVTVADEADEDGGTVTVHRLKQSWVEDEASWIARDATNAWGAAGAKAPQSSDATPVATFQPDAIGATIDVPLPASLVQGWVTNPSTNHGIVIMRGTSQQHVHLNSHDSPGPWSKLAIDYY